MPDEKDLDSLTEETRMFSSKDLDALRDEAQSGPVGAIKTDPLPELLRPRLEVTRGAAKGQTFTIDKPMVMLGRVEGVVDIHIDDAASSRHHAAIAHQHGRFVIYDMGSTNGTYVDGKRVESRDLRPDSRITIGDTELVFRLA